ncbi:hypothetical protein TRFO_06279 [Tritrichomonas foetus]|uniref:Ankyrin repeat protein n=1 Tax=Tritrichomonas foetus TaxID=1144522 RepID=A0A1J4JZJ2_9EUKA|nr:hypothetical protein TRFO_06279 [Tritrichomonas foetus]|eukprot:OHT04403.1 hypothetical protein TRFO_06279 [Tritrichomonas foetus]
MKVAVKYGNTEIVNILLTQKTMNGLTQNSYSRNVNNENIHPNNSNVDIKKRRMTNKAKSALLDDAIKANNIQLVQTLVSHLDIPTKGIIFNAIKLGNCHFVQELIDNHLVDINEKNEVGVL